MAIAALRKERGDAFQGQLQEGRHRREAALRWQSWERLPSPQVCRVEGAAGVSCPLGGPRQCLRRNTGRGWGERTFWAPRVGSGASQLKARLTTHHTTGLHSNTRSLESI